MDRERVLFGEWHPWLRDPIDVLRWAFVGGTIGWAATQHWTAVGLAIASAVLIWAHVLKLPRPYDLALIAALFLIAWGTAFNFYGQFQYYDKLVHTLSPALWLPALYVVLVRLGILPDLEELETPHNELGLFLILWALGVAIGAGYEIAEWIATYAGVDTLSHGELDTATDLICDFGGSAAGAWFFVAWSTRGWGEVWRVRGSRLRARARGR